MEDDQTNSLLWSKSYSILNAIMYSIFGYSFMLIFLSVNITQVNLYINGILFFSLLAAILIIIIFLKRNTGIMYLYNNHRFFLYFFNHNNIGMKIFIIIAVAVVTSAYLKITQDYMIYLLYCFLLIGIINGYFEKSFNEEEEIKFEFRSISTKNIMDKQKWMKRILLRTINLMKEYCINININEFLYYLNKIEEINNDELINNNKLFILKIITSNEFLVKMTNLGLKINTTPYYNKNYRK
jgi:hypothetical protein